MLNRSVLRWRSFLQGTVMFRPETCRLLFALAVLAVLQATSRAQVPGLPVQGPATVPAAHNPAQSSVLSPSTVPRTAVATPTVNPTPEQLGDSLQGRQRYQAAIAAYAKEPHPTAAIWNKMGIAYQMMYNVRDATRCYKEALKLEPRDAMVYNNLGTLYDSNKVYGNAEKMYRRALKLDPHSAVVLKNLGTNLLTQHKYAKGWQVYQQALAIDPSIFQSHNNPTVQNPSSVSERGAMNYYMARGCVRTGQLDCAIEYLRLAMDEGFINAKKVATDEDFATLRGSAAFQQLLADQKQQRRNP